MVWTNEEKNALLASDVIFELSLLKFSKDRIKILSAYSLNIIQLLGWIHLQSYTRRTKKKTSRCE